jgi:hypothetical protein
VAFAAEEMRRRFHVHKLPRVEDDAAHTSTFVARKQTPELIDHRLGANDLVLGLGGSNSDKAIAYTLRWLKAAGGLLQCEFDGEPWLLVVSGDYRGFAFSRRFAGEVLDFELASRQPFRFRDHSSGTTWNFIGEALSGPRAGGKLDLMSDSYVSKWSDWSLAHPAATIGDHVTRQHQRVDPHHAYS